MDRTSLKCQQKHKVKESNGRYKLAHQNYANQTKKRPLAKKIWSTLIT